MQLFLHADARQFFDQASFWMAEYIFKFALENFLLIFVEIYNLPKTLKSLINVKNTSFLLRILYDPI